MATYSEYKDSGQAWLGAIPSHWSVDSMKHLFSVRSIKGHPELPQLCSTQRYGVIPQSLYDNRVVSVLKGLDTLKVVNVGDFVISLRSFQGGIEYAHYDGIISPAYTILKPVSVSNSPYYRYLLKSQAFIFLLQSMVTGIREGQNIDYSSLRYESIPIPPLVEQEAIVEYLDKATAEIDKAIEAKERIIAALEERRKIIITEAVTLGINPDVPLRDSGIDWLGQIPAHWEMKKFKNHAQVKSNLVDPNKYLQYPQISPDCIEKGTGILLGYTTVKDSGVISDNHLFHKGQIVYSKIRPILNKVIIAPFDGLCSADMYPIETNGDSKYLLYLMLSNFFASQISVVVAERVKMPKINKQELGSMLIPIPPLEEQKAIVDFLENSLKPIENLMKQQKRLIQLLRERKNIIINEAVTGHRVPVSAVRACSGTAERSHDCTK